MDEYHFESDRPRHTTRYLTESVTRIIRSQIQSGRVFEVGCGNGANAKRFASAGYSVTAVDTSESGISHAKKAPGSIQFHVGSAYDDLASSYGTFPVVISLEVIEHCFYPRLFAKNVFELVAPGGIAIVSTPYHGYLKNLALAVTGRMDAHFTALWDGGHIKFWSRNTLRKLLLEAGFSQVEFFRVGRFAPLAKSMIAVARKHSEPMVHAEK
jgi:2-polyprenyl-3-methyl-5-hydroxy-6-metoxy-1,4-benzoquinol methylase